MSGVDLSTLNEPQRAIATTLDSPLFVEAGAGSGKTFTLTRRVAWALSAGSGADGGAFLSSLDQVLVITFTNAAAREIKERVRSTLRAAGMHEAALAVDSAWISTIHGMCGRILRRNALDLGLDPEFGVCGTHREDELLTQAVEQAVGVARKSVRPDSVGARAFEELGYGGVVSRALALVQAAHACANGFDGLRFGRGGGVARQMADLTRSYEALGSVKLSAAAKNAVLPSLEALHAFAELPPGERTATRAAEALDACKMPRPSKAIADVLADAKAELAHARVLVALECVHEFAPFLLELARRTDQRYDELKRSLSLLDNDDLVTLALRAVQQNESVARRYAGRFKLVMVDEFQDTDAKQLKLISILAGSDGGHDPAHLATVGDAQQSIYRFRGADVAVFNERGTRVSKAGHVRLDVNYRSAPDVLSFVDKVCGGPHGVLNGFMHLDPCPTRKDGYVARSLPRISVELASARGRVGRRRVEVLARQVADRLACYRDAGESVGGMALLLGSTTNADLYIDALRDAGMECVVTGGSTFTKAPEVAVMLALLRTLANPHDTQSGLFPLLSSGMFELDANDFLQLGSRKQERLDAPTKRTIDRGLESLELYGDAVPSARLRHAHDVLMSALASLATKPVADVCMDVLRDSGWLSRLEAQGAEGAAQEANVLAAVRYIRDLTDELGLGPSRAAAEFAHWLEVSKVPPASLAGAEHNTVRVMTIHASKGLEYPVVAVAECWNNPRRDSGVWSASAGDGARNVVITPAGGAKVDDMSDETLNDDLASLAYDICMRNAADDAQEKARLLYVALTRAREALVLAMGVPLSKMGISSDLAAGVLEALFGGELPPAGQCSVDYGGTEPALVRHVVVSRDKYDPIVIDDGGALPCVVDCAANDSLDGITDSPREVALYPMEAVGCTTARMPRAREDVFSYSSALAGKESPVAEARPQRPKLPPREEREAQVAGEPVSSDEDKATNLGSAFHMVAQTMVQTGKEPRAERIEALSKRWNLSARQRARLDVALANWCASDLRAEALRWDVVRAEVPFFALSGGSPHGAYVEGAIDLLCTNGTACEGPALVVDYKTGDVGLSPEQVQARHVAQAELYAGVLLSLGFSHVDCAFIAVETGIVARYEFG